MIFTIRGDPFDFGGVCALRAGEGFVKNCFQSFFLGPYGIPHAYKCQAQNLFKNFNLSIRLIGLVPGSGWEWPGHGRGLGWAALLGIFFAGVWVLDQGETGGLWGVLGV